MQTRRHGGELFVSPNIAENLYHPLKHHRDKSEYVLRDYFSNLFSTRRNHVKCLMCKRELFRKNQLEVYSQQYHSILMNDGQLPNGILPPAGWDQAETS
jgi:hypothetical protein